MTMTLAQYDKTRALADALDCLIDDIYKMVARAEAYSRSVARPGAEDEIEQARRLS